MGIVHRLPTPQGSRLQRTLRREFMTNTGRAKLRGRHHVAGVEWYRGALWLVLDYPQGCRVVRFDDDRLDDMADTWVPFAER